MKIFRRQILLCFLLFLSSFYVLAQKKPAFVSGKVLDENENPLPNVSITILGQAKGITSNDSGFFRLSVAANKAFALIFSYTGYKTEQRNFILNEEELENITVRMEKGERTLQ